MISLFSLTPEQRRFMWRKQISDARTPDAWLELFRPLVAFESDLGKGGCLAVVLAVGAAVLLLSGVSNLLERGGLLSGTILSLLGLGCAAFFLGVRLRLRGRHLQQGLNPLLAVLREDMKANDTVTLTVDLRGAERAENKLGQRDLPARGAYTKIVETSFAEHWLKGDATLADGTRLVWELADYVRREKRTKCTSRGKTKWKTKFRVATHLKLELGWRKDRFVRRESAGADAALREDDRRSWLKLRRTFRHATGDAFHAGQFVQTVAAGYARVEPAGGAS